jgi:putative transposase
MSAPAGYSLRRPRSIPTKPGLPSRPRLSCAKKLGAAIVMHDRDTKFTAGFDAALKKEGPEAHRAPNTAAYVERFVQSIKQECLDYFVVFGQRHMDHLCREFVQHYDTERPHQGLDNELLKQRGKKRKRQSDLPLLGDIACRTRLGGLLIHYHRKAA